MTDNLEPNESSGQGSCNESYDDYLNRAVAACEAGDLVLGMHLYLAAYERAVVDPDIADGMALSGLQEAWNLACNLKERSMAEYVFEKLEPFLTGEEIAECANTLQSLALDRLEEYGFSREELQDMAEMISQDLIDGEGSIVAVESISRSHVVPGGMAEALADIDQPDEGEEALDEADVDDEPAEGARSREPQMKNASPDFNPYDFYKTSSVGTSYHAATNEGSDSYVFTRDEERATELERANEAASSSRAVASVGTASHPRADEVGEGTAIAEPAATENQEAQQASAKGAEASADHDSPRQITPPASMQAQANMDKIPSMPQVPMVDSKVFNYQGLAGYRDTVAVMRDMGIGLQREPGFRNFIKMMNARHGLDRMPALDTLLFRAPIIEDATRFVDATIGEIGLPVLRMSMEEGFQGAPVLCVTTNGENRPRMNHAQNRFGGPCILVLDDLDMWVMPHAPEPVDGIAGFVMANVSRGAREAMGLIRSAVEDPDVYVLATASALGEVDPFFYDLLEPISIIEIALPTEEERDDIWREILRNHSSMSSLDRATLTRFSEGLPRYDIYIAARSAVEEAYKMGLADRTFLPVTPQNIFDKLAACQPLDSDEYRAIEDEVVRDFRSELEHLEDLMNGAAE